MENIIIVNNKVSVFRDKCILFFNNNDNDDDNEHFLTVFIPVLCVHVMLGDTDSVLCSSAHLSCPFKITHFNLGVFPAAID